MLLGAGPDHAAGHGLAGGIGAPPPLVGSLCHRRVFSLLISSPRAPQVVAKVATAALAVLVLVGFCRLCAGCCTDGYADGGSGTVPAGGGGVSLAAEKARVEAMTADDKSIELYGKVVRRAAEPGAATALQAYRGAKGIGAGTGLAGLGGGGERSTHTRDSPHA